MRRNELERADYLYYGILCSTVSYQKNLYWVDLPFRSSTSRHGTSPQRRQPCSRSLWVLTCCVPLDAATRWDGQQRRRREGTMDRLGEALMAGPRGRRRGDNTGTFLKEHKSTTPLPRALLRLTSPFYLLFPHLLSPFSLSPLDLCSLSLPNEKKYTSVHVSVCARRIRRHARRR